MSTLKYYAVVDKHMDWQFNTSMDIRCTHLGTRSRGMSSSPLSVKNDPDRPIELSSEETEPLESLPTGNEVANRLTTSFPAEADSVNVNCTAEYTELASAHLSDDFGCTIRIVCEITVHNDGTTSHALIARHRTCDQASPVTWISLITGPSTTTIVDSRFINGTAAWNSGLNRYAPLFCVMYVTILCDSSMISCGLGTDWEPLRGGGEIAVTLRVIANSSPVL